MDANLKNKYLKEIDALLKRSKMLMLKPEEVLTLINSRNLDHQMIIDSYSEYLTKHSYTYWATEDKYISSTNKLKNFQGFISNGMYNLDHRIDDAQTQYLLGGMRLADLKAKCEEIERNIKND